MLCGTSAATSGWPSRPSTTCSGYGETRHTTGKPAGNDIRQRKKSMPIVAALAAGDDGARELESLLFDARAGSAPTWPSAARPAARAAGRPSGTVRHNGAVVLTDQVIVAAPDWSPAPLRYLSPEDLARATWLVEACGGREWTAARAKAHLDAALGSLERARLSAVPRRALADLAVYVVERES